MKKESVRPMNDRKVLSFRKPSESKNIKQTSNANHTKQKTFQAIQNNINQLCKHFPALFNVNEPKPLKLGILDDIITSGLVEISRIACRKALGAYTSSTHYLKAVIDNTSRYDLAGNACETIAEEHKTYAKNRLQLKAKIAAKRAEKGD